MIASLFTGLFLVGFISAASAAQFLLVYGIMLLLAETVVASFGTLAINGILALYVAWALYNGNSYIPGFPLDWPLVFGIAFVELVIIIAAIVTIRQYSKIKTITGMEAMIGKKATVVEWHDTSGSVHFEGGPWKAFSDISLRLEKNTEVTVQAIEGLKLKIIP